MPVMRLFEKFSIFILLLYSSFSFAARVPIGALHLGVALPEPTIGEASPFPACAGKDSLALQITLKEALIVVGMNEAEANVYVKAMESNPQSENNIKYLKEAAGLMKLLPLVYQQLRLVSEKNIAENIAIEECEATPARCLPGYARKVQDLKKSVQTLLPEFRRAVAFSSSKLVNRIAGSSAPLIDKAAVAKLSPDAWATLLPFNYTPSHGYMTLPSLATIGHSKEVFDLIDVFNLDSQAIYDFAKAQPFVATPQINTPESFYNETVKKFKAEQRKFYWTKYTDLFAKYPIMGYLASEKYKEDEFRIGLASVRKNSEDFLANEIPEVNFENYARAAHVWSSFSRYLAYPEAVNPVLKKYPQYCKMAHQAHILYHQEKATWDWVKTWGVPISFLGCLVPAVAPYCMWAGPAYGIASLGTGYYDQFKSEKYVLGRVHTLDTEFRHDMTAYGEQFRRLQGSTALFVLTLGLARGLQLPTSTSAGYETLTSQIRNMHQNLPITEGLIEAGKIITGVADIFVGKLKAAGIGALVSTNGELLISSADPTKYATYEKYFKALQTVDPKNAVRIKLKDVSDKVSKARR